MNATVERSVSSSLLRLLPVAGMGLFVLLYVIATLLYPGGSSLDKTSVGFDWLHNYWCDLLAYKSHNGLYNSARPVAIAAMGILCIALASFWYMASLFYPSSRTMGLVIRFSGLMAMGLAFFIFTPYHDLIVNLAGLFGAITLIAWSIVLYQCRKKAFLLHGCVNLFLLIINNYVYHTPRYLVYLPVVQKLSMVSFLAWICWITIANYRK